VRAQAEDPDAYGDDYQRGDYGRIRFQENGVTILRASSDDDQEASEEAGSVNSPLFPGDSVRTGSDQRIEVQLASATLVRIDQDSQLTFQSLPDSRASYQDNAVLSLASGTTRILTSKEIREKDEFRIDTPAASIYLLGDGDYRIEVDSRGKTLVASNRGVAEVVGEGGSVLVRGGTRTLVAPGSVPDSPRAFSTLQADGFDRWCSDRNRIYTTGVRGGGDRNYDSNGYDSNGYDSNGYDDVPSEVQPYSGELSSYGRWVDTPDYGRAWTPSGVGSDWRPYDDGYWDYGPGGYFWVSNEPWGWAPYHYGRWNFVGGTGWCWSPGRIFAGAWVSWSLGPLYVGWAPLDFWGRPCFRNSISFGFYDPRCWSFVSYQHIAMRNIRRFAVPVNRIGDRIRDHVVSTRPPRVDPRRLANSPDFRARAVRELRNDTRAQMRPIDRDRTPARRFTDFESRVAGQRPDVRRAGADARPRNERTTDSRPSRSQVDPRSPRDTQQARPDSRDDRDRRTTPPPRNERRGPEAPSRDNRENGGMHRPYPRAMTTDPRVDERRPQSDDRVREMYRNLSRPRETRERDPQAHRTPQDDPQSRDARPQSPRVEGPRQQPRDPRMEGPRQQPRDPRMEGARQRPRDPRMEGPRQQPRDPRMEGPRQQPRPQPRVERPQASRSQPRPSDSGKRSAPKKEDRSGDKKRR
jgi:hypothetical protein